MPMTEATIIVTKLRQEDGIWRARISTAGTTLDVDRRFGSWQADVPNGRRGQRDRREVLPAAAAILQRKVRRLERAAGQEVPTR
jgi:hypothetical protein